MILLVFDGSQSVILQFWSPSSRTEVKSSVARYMFLYYIETPEEVYIGVKAEVVTKELETHQGPNSIRVKLCHSHPPIGWYSQTDLELVEVEIPT